MSTSASISTATLPGNVAQPTDARAWQPISVPKTSTKKFEAPLMTAERSGIQGRHSRSP
jgi:hypothetical protein